MTLEEEIAYWKRRCKLAETFYVLNLQDREPTDEEFYEWMDLRRKEKIEYV
jgi:hypothetical protein